MNIPKTALRLNRFKNLLAYTMVAASTALPAVAYYFLIKSDAVAPGLPTAAISTLFLFAQGALLISMASGDKSLYVTSHHFWKKAFNTPLEKLQKSQNEKIFLTLREFGDEHFHNLNPQQLELIAKLYVERQMNLPNLSQWMQEANASQNKVQLETLTKDSLISQKLHNLIHFNWSIQPRIIPYIEREVGKVLQATSVHLNIDKLGKLRNRKNADRQYNLVAVMETQIDFLLKYGYQLKEKDYQHLEKLFKTEKSGTLHPLFEIFYKYPKTVNWSRIQECFRTYKNEDYFYNRNASAVKALTVEEGAQQTQDKILATVEAQVQNVVSDTKTTTGAVSRESEFEQQLNEFMLFKPNYYPEKWAQIKTQYEEVRAHRDGFQAFELVEFFVSLHSSLNVLIISDKAIEKMPAKHQSAAKQLLADNLDLSILLSEELHNKIGEKHLKTLEVHKNYQTQKLRA